jgi:uncharacterized protein (TIGR02453 family)
MTTYFTDDTFAFLRELKRNNERAWFNENKARYERSVKGPALAFINGVAPHLKRVSTHLVADPRPVGGAMFRIYRDTRFSKDKSPYKTHVGIHFSLRDGVHTPGFYLHVEPNASMVAAGIWMPDAEGLQQIREAIAAKPTEWRKASGDLDEDEGALKRPPRGFDPAHPMIEDLKRKTFTGSLRVSDGQLKSDDAVTTFVATCKELTPLVRFLAKAVDAPW